MKVCICVIPNFGLCCVQNRLTRESIASIRGVGTNCLLSS
jgi:hypothetical protein